MKEARISILWSFWDIFIQSQQYILKSWNILDFLKVKTLIYKKKYLRLLKRLEEEVNLDKHAKARLTLNALQFFAPCPFSLISFTYILSLAPIICFS